MTETPPDIPGIKILGKCGVGGMSTVWKAIDLECGGRTIAVKVLNREYSDRRSDIKLFLEEERAMERIDHPGIVKSYGSTISHGIWYIKMEYVDGYNFAALLGRKLHLIEADCLLICESVAAALDYAWNDHGIVHCDIKPENIMINSDGVVKLTDLGICRTFSLSGEDEAEVPEHILGTPAYISPEQVYGDMELDCRSDIYSLAASVYHLATGRMLFPGLDNDQTLRAHCDETTQAKDPRAYRPELSEGFCQMLEAMLVKNRDDRVNSWTDVISMCLAVEKGGKFKPRSTTGASSIALDRI